MSYPIFWPLGDLHNYLFENDLVHKSLCENAYESLLYAGVLSIVQIQLDGEDKQIFDFCSQICMNSFLRYHMILSLTLNI